MSVFKVLALLLACVMACSAYYNAATITNVGTIKALGEAREITCKLYDIVENVNITLDYSYTDKANYTTWSYEPYHARVKGEKLGITVFNYNNELAPIHLSLNSSESQLSFDFVIHPNNITLYVENATSKWKESKYRSNILPFYQFKDFEIILNNDYIAFYEKNVSLVYWVPTNATNNSIYDFNIANHYGASAAIWINDTQTISTKNTVDLFNTICFKSDESKNDTEHNNKTRFITMIEAQYQNGEIMTSDLYNLKNDSNSEKITREYLNELHEDIKQNYKISKQLHYDILSSYTLTQNEVSAKTNYLKYNTFNIIRASYFKLIKLIELIISRFN